jgi:hypothetical protein
MHPVFSRTQNGRPAQLICPCLIGRKDLMTKFYPAAVGDTSDKVLVGKMSLMSCPALFVSPVAPDSETGGSRLKGMTVRTVGELERSSPETLAPVRQC